MSDIDPRDCADGLADTGQNMIESPRQQLAERSREIDNLKQQVVYYINKSETDYDKFTESQAEAERYKAAWESSHNQAIQNGQAALESQAREKVRIRYLELIANVNAMDYEYKSWARAALDIPAEKLK